MPCRDVGLPQEFFAQASRGEVLAEVGLTDRNIARQITGWVAALGATVDGARRQRAPRLIRRGESPPGRCMLSDSVNKC